MPAVPRWAADIAARREPANPSIPTHATKREWRAMTAAQTTNRTLKLLLRLAGGSMLFAMIFVVAPESWMIAIHEALDMGTLPTVPVVGYLARSLSAFYAMFGGLFLLASFDVVRHRTVLVYLSWATTVFGAVMIGIDLFEGMPTSWTLSEGPFVILFGLALLWFSTRLTD